MEQSGLSVDIDRASLVSLTTIDHIDADHQAEHHEFGVLWERASAVRADLAERIVWLPLTELICSSDARVANLAAVTREHLSSQPVLRSTTRR